MVQSTSTNFIIILDTYKTLRNKTYWSIKQSDYIVDIPRTFLWINSGQVLKLYELYKGHVKIFDWKKKHISFFRFDVIHCGDIEKLIKKRQAITDPYVFFFNRISLHVPYRVHTVLKLKEKKPIYFCRTRLLLSIFGSFMKYANVTRDVLNLIKEMCEECQLKKRKIASKGLVVKPLLIKDSNSRGQVDLVDIKFLKKNICFFQLNIFICPL
jgi:hypothetical protein